jgi:ribosomal protein S18 acetylase RimI-like enzyme
MIKSFYPKEPINYLWFIGVDPEYTNKGAGTRLLHEIIKDSDRPIYLETSVHRNLSWYQKNGFELYHTLPFPYGPLYLLRTTY